MNDFIKNKKQLIVLVFALAAGITLGWFIKPSGPETSASTQHVHKEDEVWTCSMHPQIRQPEPGKCPLCGMELIPASSANKASSPLVYEMTPEAVALASVQTSKVTGVSPEGEVFLTGKITVDERNLASITAKYPGRIEDLMVNFTGQHVHKGQKMAVIYSPELLNAQKELLEAAKTKALYPELYQAAREKLRLWKLSENQIAEIESSGRVKDTFDVLADKSGIVTQRNISKGDYVNTGSVLFNIADLNKVWVKVDAYETDLPFVKSGDKISFSVAALPGKTFQAKVTYIDPIVNPRTRAASVRAEVVNHNLELKPDMFVNASVRSKVKPADNALAIPRTALLWTGKRSVVYVKKSGSEFPAFEMREITLGSRMGDMYMVKAGLEAGEEIVTNGVFALDAAAQLNGNYSMMNRPENLFAGLPAALTSRLNEFTHKYFTLKNVFIDSDAAKAAEIAGEMKASLATMSAEDLSGKALDVWAQESERIRKSLEEISEIKNISDQRRHFKILSDAMVNLLKQYRYNSEVVYVAYCPMAVEDEGALWLSEFEEIKNPYFGEAMLRCGEVKEVVRPLDGAAGQDQAPAQQHVH